MVWMPGGNRGTRRRDRRSHRHPLPGHETSDPGAHFHDDAGGLVPMVIGS